MRKRKVSLAGKKKARRREKIEVLLHERQADFLYADALFRGFVGGRGAGKTWIGAYDLITKAKPGRRYGVYAPTYPMLHDATVPKLLAVTRKLHFLKEHRRGDRELILGNNAVIMYRSVDDPEHARGPDLSGAWLDEASVMKKEAYDVILGCLREGGEQGGLTATFTPKGRAHWTYQEFAKTAGAVLITASSWENPFLPENTIKKMERAYTRAYAQQEIYGQFVDLGHALMQREWFEIVDRELVPKNLRMVRFWDLAATEKQRKGDPDFTAGCLMGEADGRVWILDMRHERLSPRGVERLITGTASQDGFDVQIDVELEGGATGKLYVDSLRRKSLRGYAVKAVPPKGDKVTRAMPFAAAAENGEVKIVRGLWNEAFLEEIEAFPDGDHDDQVDAASGAYTELVTSIIMPSGPMPYERPLARDDDWEDERRPAKNDDAEDEREEQTEEQSQDDDIDLDDDALWEELG